MGEREQPVDAETEATMDLIRRSFELFNADEADTLFADLFDPDVRYSADPQISALVGSPTEIRGIDAVRETWRAFFEVFDNVQLTEIEFEEASPGRAIGSAHMVTRGGSSETPVDAPFYFAFAIRDGRLTFMAAKLDRDATVAALDAHLTGR
jgi:ketosteroid isomerase-like protein